MSLPDPDAIDAVLLDLDDTILDDRAGVRGAWDVVAARVVRRHADLDAADVRAEIADVTDWFWSDPARERAGRLDLLRARARIVGRVLERLGRADPALAEEAARIYTEHRERSYRPAAGAIEALAGLRRRFRRTALVTNGAAAPQRAKIERFRLLGFFDHVQVEGEFGLGKPEPRVYEHVLGVLEVRPERALMVGDNYQADVLGPLAAGLHAAWIDLEGSGRPPAAAPRPHATVRSLAELAERLDCAGPLSPGRPGTSRRRRPAGSTGT